MDSVVIAWPSETVVNGLKTLGRKYMGCTTQKEVRLEKASEPKNELFANGSEDGIEYIVDEGREKGWGMGEGNEAIDKVGRRDDQDGPRYRENIGLERIYCGCKYTPEYDLRKIRIIAIL